MSQPVASHLLPTYNRAPIAFERGEGAWLQATNGERYLDFGAGVAVTSLGHAHPALVRALTEQAQKVWHNSNLYQSPQGEALAAKLCENSFADVIFFGNSGAEALECAIKMARKYHAAKGAPERYRIMTFEGAFHGRTMANLAAQKKYLEGFGPPLEGFDQVAFGDHKALEAAISPATAAILIEPIQGEGGIRMVPPQCLRGLRALCDQHGLLLIYDEVQTGIGRTGRLFAHQGQGADPDIMALAKGLGGGFPMGACLATGAAAAGMVAGTHGSTFGGNALAMACGNTVMDTINDPAFLEHVRHVALNLRQRLAALHDQHPHIFAELRGEGLMLGLRLKVPVADMVDAARAQKLLVIAAGDNVVRLLPPLIITDAEAAEAVARLDRAATALERAHKLEHVA